MSTIAAIDTATDDVSVAVVRDREVVDQRLVPKPARGHPKHSEALLVELEEAVGEAGGWEAIDLLAAGVGPGSFTGLRVGLATVRAIAQALGKAIVPVGTLAALGHGIGERAPGAGRLRLPVLDARRRQVFGALFTPDDQPCWESFVASPGELAERVAGLSERPLAAGSGALRFRGELEAAGAEVLPDADSAHRLWARHIGRLAEDGVPSPPESIQPIYLRPPDAQVWLERDSP